MNKLPFKLPGKFLRGNLHTHSTNSDGAKSPADVIASYREAGYDFLALTDHFLERYNFPLTDTRSFRDAQFTTVIGAELHTDKTELGEMWHILSVGLPLDFAPTAPDESAAALCARARAAGAFVAAAHPHWYGVTVNDVLSLGEIDAVETFNATCHGHNDRGDSWAMLDSLLAQGRHYLACATDDAHFRSVRHDWQVGWVQVKAAYRDPAAILDALKAGHYYSSTGPVIHDVAFEAGNKVRIACSPCASIFIAGRTSQGRMQAGDNLTEATFDLEGITSPYLRVTVRDSTSHRAWTNPIWRS